MRVLHVAQATTEGVGRFVVQAAADQAQRGWEVAVASPPEPRLVEECRAAGVLHRPWSATRSPVVRWRELRGLRRVVREVDPTVVVLHASKAGLVGRLVLRGRRPTVFCPHAWSFLDGRRAVRTAALGWERWAARWTTNVLCVSPAEAARGVAARIDATIRTVPNCVDRDRFRPASEPERVELRARLGLGDAPVAVCVGRLSRQKGQDVLLAAWPEVLRQVPDAQLVLVGDGPARGALEARRPPRVTFAGLTEDVRGWLAAADVAVQPSRWEGASFATLEALACGCSLVLTAVDGALDALGDAGCGTVVPVDDPGPLAAALVARLGDLRRAGLEGEQARIRSAAFDEAGWGDRLAEVLESAERMP